MIIVKNRQLLFSNRENYIGTSYDNNSTNLAFKLDRVNEDGYDMSGLSFMLKLKYSDDGTSDAVLLQSDVSDTAITLYTALPATMMSHEGTHLVQLIGFDESGTFKWSSYQNVLYIENALAAVPVSAENLTVLEQYEAKISGEIKKLETSETKRESAETERSEAEKLRASAETERAEAETERKNAESKRVEVVTALTENYNTASLMAMSYAVGGTGVREGEDKDNAKYYKDHAQAIKQGALHGSTDNYLYFGEAVETPAAEGLELEGAVTRDVTDASLKLQLFKDKTARAAIEVLNGDNTITGSVKKTVADEVAKIIADAPESFDTLKEIADWITNHSSDASAMNSKINANTANIEQNKKDISSANTAIANEIKRATAAEGKNASDIAAHGTRLGNVESSVANLTDTKLDKTDFDNLFEVVHTW